MMKPILFNTEMVRAILDERKTVTRRVVKLKYSNTHIQWLDNKYGRRLVEMQNDVEGETFGKNPDGTTWHKVLACRDIKPQYSVGDILYVRETWCELCRVDEFGYTHFDESSYYYATEGDYQVDLYDADGFHLNDQRMKWRPSIHMPKEAARIFLRVTNVKVERLQDITPYGIHCEGCSGVEDDTGQGIYYTLHPRDEFIDIWNSTIKKDSQYTWAHNPCVWVFEFERCEKPKEET